MSTAALIGLRYWNLRIRRYFKLVIFDQRLGNWFGVVLAILGGLFFAMVMAKMGFKIGALLIGVIIGIPMIFASMFYPFFGVVLILSISYILLGVKRFLPNVPVGLFTDVMVLVLAFGVFFDNLRKKDWRFAKGPISRAVLFYMIYVFFAVANPVATCKLCYVYTIRSMAGYMLMYFIVSYAIKSKDHIKFLVKLWIFLSCLAGLYAIKQEWIGFSDAEFQWIHADPETFWLLFQWGRIRKFSFMSDPVSFGFNMAYTVVLCIVLLFSKLSAKRKIPIGIAAGIMFQAMLYSGTRAAFVIIPLGAVLFIVLCRNKQIHYIVAVGAVFFVALIFVPTDNMTIRRFQSAFRPSDDASYLVRIENQKRIRPFIWANPLGGGLGATGVWGKRFAPDAFLSDFPPDSGYVRVAVELGWIGLTLNIFLWATVLIEGVKSVFTIRDPIMKYIALSMLCTLFSLYIVNFAQQAVSQLPASLLFWVAAAILNRGGKIEIEKMPSENPDQLRQPRRRFVKKKTSLLRKAADNLM